MHIHLSNQTISQRTHRLALVWGSDGSYTIEAMTNITDYSQTDTVVSIHFSMSGINVNNSTITRWVPKIWVVLHNIVTNTDNDIGIGETTVGVVIRLQAHTAQGHWMTEGHHTFCHKGIGNRDAQLF